MKKILLLLSVTSLLLVACNQTKETEKETKKETQVETQVETNSEIDESKTESDETKYADRTIDFKRSDLEITDYNFAEGTSEQQKKEYTDFMNDLFPYGVEWQVKMFNKELEVSDYKWNEDVLKQKNSTPEQYHEIMVKTISGLKNKGFYPNLDAATCQVFVDKGEIKGLVVYTPWISDSEKTVNKFEVHLAPDKSLMGAGIKSVE